MVGERELYLLVRKNRSKLSRLKYRFTGKEKTLAIAPLPACRSRRLDIRSTTAPGASSTWTLASPESMCRTVGD
jgi:hypothetical protein